MFCLDKSRDFASRISGTCSSHFRVLTQIWRLPTHEGCWRRFTMFFHTKLKLVELLLGQFLVSLQHVFIKSYTSAISSDSWPKQPSILLESLNLFLPKYVRSLFSYHVNFIFLRLFLTSAPKTVTVLQIFNTSNISTSRTS